MTASDPDGDSLTISGSVDGNDFVCPAGDTCTVALPEGSGNIIYRAFDGQVLSGDQSLSYAYDPTPPNLAPVANGSAGANNWFVSNVEVDAHAEDPTSGLDQVSYNLDGTGWQEYTAPLTLSDGVHTLEFQAVDQAGNANSASATIPVDTTLPSLTPNISGTTGSNGWYVSPTYIWAEASDDLSGLAALIYNLDGSGWMAYTDSLLLNDGVHTVEFQALDGAGNVNASSSTVQVDSSLPLLDTQVNGTSGLNGWYVSQAEVSASASDAVSGLASLDVSQDGGSTWTAYSGPLSYPDGQRRLQFRATDLAGNQTLSNRIFLGADAVPPDIDLRAAFEAGQSVRLGASDSGSGLLELSVTIRDFPNDRWPRRVVGYNDVGGTKYDSTFTWDGRFQDGSQAPPGEYLAIAKARDRAGNESSEEATVTVYSNAILPLIFTPPTAVPTPVVTAPVVEEESAAAAVPVPPAPPMITPPQLNPLIQEAPVFGGQISSTGSQNAGATNTANGILWGAAAAAVIGQMIATDRRTKEEEEAKRRRKEQMDAIKKAAKSSGPRKLSYRQIAKAYQASLDNLKANLVKLGLSPEQASEQKKLAIQNGKIEAATTVFAGIKAQESHNRQEVRKEQDNAEVAAKNDRTKRQKQVRPDPAGPVGTTDEALDEKKALRDAQNREIAEERAENAEAARLAKKYDADGPEILSVAVGTTAEALAEKKTQRNVLNDQRAEHLAANVEAERIAKKYDAEGPEILSAATGTTAEALTEKSEKRQLIIEEKIEEKRLAHLAEKYDADGFLISNPNPSFSGFRDSSKLSYQSVQGESFIKDANDTSDIDPNDIAQGLAPDCGFLSGLSAIAQQKPDLIQNMLTDNKDNHYSVRFFYFSENTNVPSSIYVRIDDKLPLFKNQQSPKTYFANFGDTDSNSGNIELWAPLIEKAYVAYKEMTIPSLMGQGYTKAGSSGSGAMEIISGCRSQEYLTNKLDLKDFLDLSDKFNNQNYGMTADALQKGEATSSWYTSNILHTGHVYNISYINAWEDVDGIQGDITVRNPYGASRSGYEVKMSIKEFRENFNKLAINALLCPP